MANKGLFKPTNPSKYKGNPTNIVYRSSWELRLMIHLDSHPDVIEWSSEEFAIPYISPIDGRRHRYFPDFFIKQKNKDGLVEHVLVEVKPKAQTVPPKPQHRVTKRYLTEVRTWGVNSAKWAAAEAVCKAKGWRFVKITEDDLGITR